MDWLEQLKAYHSTNKSDAGATFEFGWKTLANNRHCPKCGHLNDSMQNTIQDKKGQTVSRECQACGLWYSGPNFEPYVSGIPTPIFGHHFDTIIMDDIADDLANNMTTLDGEPWKEYMKRYDAIQRPEADELPRTQHLLSDGSERTSSLPDGTEPLG